MAIKLDSGFEILYLSYLDDKGMTVEIQYQGQQVAQINKEKGVDNMEIEIYSQYVYPDFISELKFPLKDFLEALNIMSQALSDL
ncbi:hypothetical protein NIES267_15660 [Calothrix parasitica NIES-267]|uniref:Uncharacterized protein n=1 Tax=Calothrix parasitica NIES-267 TaxID=1973488 RepID=A0A1Z4LLX0_9CYAN|nr:hypothetical protein NIES267_15660 [Calothrix parasitica NIES-267]